MSATLCNIIPISVWSQAKVISFIPALGADNIQVTPEINRVL